jgi:hypothetical protein
MSNKPVTDCGRFEYNKEFTMKTLTCDVCGKTIDNPVTARTYFHFVQYDICEACHDQLEASIKPTVRSHAPFTYDWYEQLFIDSLTKGVQKGKFEKA